MYMYIRTRPNHSTANFKPASILLVNRTSIHRPFKSQSICREPSVGATGYLGLTLALSLLRSSNYQVYGIARSQAEAKSLAQLEITPILCPDIVAYSSPLLNAIQTHNISVVVACGADAEAAKLLEVTVAAGQIRIKAYTKEGVVGPKLGFYTRVGLGFMDLA